MEVLHLPSIISALTENGLHVKIMLYIITKKYTYILIGM